MPARAYKIDLVLREFVLELYGGSSAWDTPAGRDEALRAIRHLGRDYFFLRDEPRWPHVTPDWERVT